MSVTTQIREIEKKISGKILFNENLSKYSWFNLGGTAKIVFKPKNLMDLSFFLKLLQIFLCELQKEFLVLEVDL